MKFLRRNIDYLMALAVTGMGAYSFATGDAVGGWVCLGIAVGLLVVLKLLYAVSEKVNSYPDYVDDAKVRNQLRSLEERGYKQGLEPAPIPGEIQAHNAETCELCRLLKKRGIE
jgi:hypothetical protein